MSFSRAVLAEEIAGRISSGKTRGLAGSVAAYLVESGKTAEVNSLERDIMQQIAEKTGTVEVTAITAHKLSQKELDGIARKIMKADASAKTVVINQTIDRSVVGGVRLEFPNQLLDLSVSAKLSKLRQLTS